MPVTGTHPHNCGYGKHPCTCFPTIWNKKKKGKWIIFPEDEGERDEFIKYPLAKAILDNSPIEVDGVIIQGSYDATEPASRTALHLQCPSCDKIWCYTNAQDATQQPKKALRRNWLTGSMKTNLELFLAHLRKNQTLIDQLTWW